MQHLHVVVIGVVIVVIIDVAAIVDYVCEAYNNPPDFFLDVLSGSVGVTSATTSDEIALPNGESWSVVVVV